MFNKINSILKKESKVKYWEYRQENTQTNSVSAWNNHIKDLNYGNKISYSIRILYGNAWGFVYSDKEDIKQITKKALNIAKALDKETKIKKNITEYKTIKDNKKSLLKINPSNIGIEEKRNLVLNLSKPQNKKIKSALISYSDTNKKIIFINSEGSEIKQELIYTLCGAQITAKDSTIEEYSKRIGAQKGYELTKQLPEAVEFASKKAIDLLKASVPKGGIFPVICDSVLTDVFIHEALGHAAEADHVITKNSCLYNLEKKKIANDIVNVYDDPTQKYGWGSFFYDDEGIKTQRTQLIKQGYLTSFMHSRETAALMNKKPTGNARAQSAAHIPLVRMSNTYIQKGDHNKEEMFKKIKNGFYLIGSKGGQVDPTKGNFHFNAEEGFVIKNGKLKEQLKSVSLSGNTLKILKNIQAISNKYEPGMPGYCGKGGQSVHALGHCPCILIKNAIVGGK